MNQATTPVSIVAFAGPSGAGKSVLADAMLAIEPNFYKLHQMTTRPPRNNTDEYVFVNKDLIETFKERGLITCFTEFNNNMYGTLIEQVPFDFLSVVVSATGMQSLYKDIAKFEEILNRPVQILPILVSYNITEENLTKRKRSRSVEFVSNEISLLDKLHTDISGFEWFLSYDNGDDFIQAEAFKKDFFDKLKTTNVEYMKKSIMDEIALSDDLPTDVLASIQLLLKSRKINSLASEADTFLEEEKEDKTAVLDVPVQPAVEVKEDIVEPTADTDDDFDIPIISLEEEQSKADALESRQAEEEAAAKAELEASLISSSRQINWRQLSISFKNNFIDYLAETNRNQSIFLSDEMKMEEAVANFLIGQCNFSRKAIDSGEIKFTAKLETVNNILNTRIMINSDENNVAEIFKYSFDRDNKTISQ